jgi:hypothetical protein
VAGEYTFDELIQFIEDRAGRWALGGRWELDSRRRVTTP